MYIIKQIMALFNLDFNNAMKIYNDMNVDFSEATSNQINREIKAAYARFSRL